MPRLTTMGGTCTRSERSADTPIRYVGGAVTASPIAASVAASIEIVHPMHAGRAHEGVRIDVARAWCVATVARDASGRPEVAGGAVTRTHELGLRRQPTRTLALSVDADRRAPRVVVASQPPIERSAA